MRNLTFNTLWQFRGQTSIRNKTKKTFSLKWLLNHDWNEICLHIKCLDKHLKRDFLKSEGWWMILLRKWKKKLTQTAQTYSYLHSTKKDLYSDFCMIRKGIVGPETIIIVFLIKWQTTTTYPNKAMLPMCSLKNKSVPDYHQVQNIMIKEISTECLYWIMICLVRA